MRTKANYRKRRIMVGKISAIISMLSFMVFMIAGTMRTYNSITTGTMVCAIIISTIGMVLGVTVCNIITPNGNIRHK